MPGTRLPLAALTLALCFIACSTTHELSPDELRQLWTLDDRFYSSPVRIDTENESYLFEVGEAQILRGAGGDAIEGAAAGEAGRRRVTLPVEDVVRVWYLLPVSVELNGGKVRWFRSGHWFLSYDRGQAVALGEAYSVPRKDGGLDRVVDENSVAIDDIHAIRPEELIGVPPPRSFLADLFHRMFVIRWWIFATAALAAVVLVLVVGLAGGG